MSEMHASSPRAPRLSCAVAAAVDAVGSSESATETCPAALRSAARSRRKPAGVPAAPSAAQARKRRVASARANWARASPSYQSENALRSAASATSALSGRCGARIAGAPWSSRASPATAIAAHTTRISGNESSTSVSGRGCWASASTPVTTSPQASSATIAISAPTAIRAGTGG